MKKEQAEKIMNTLLTIINDGDKLFDEKFTRINYQTSVFEENWFMKDDTTPAQVKSFIHSRELALLEGLKARYEGMKIEPKSDGLEANWEQHEIHDCALDEAIAELDEAITHLKK